MKKLVLAMMAVFALSAVSFADETVAPAPGGETAAPKAEKKKGAKKAKAKKKAKKAAAAQ
jgi:hypothetical protein